MQLRQSIQSVLGLVFFVTSSFAFSNTEFTYNTDGESIEILGCENICPLNLVIPNEIDGLPVTKIGWAAFHNNHLTSVFIPNSVTTISNQAFQDNNLSSIVIPESVSTIGWWAFKDNNIEAVSLPSGLERIDDGVFLRNQLTEIIVPNNVTFIGVSAFQENEIKSITLSNNLMLISSDAFRYNNITNLNIPDSVISIDERAFFQNPLESITFVGDRPVIGKDVFALSSEKDDAYWETTFQNCTDVISDGSSSCDTITKTYSDAVSDVTLYFCDNNNGWPGESLFIWENQEYYSCNGSTPEVCEEDWTKWLVTPQLTSDCPLNESSPVNPVVNYSVFDIDKNGSVDALTDGLIMLRYFFGLRGDNLISGSIANDATRTSAAEIEAHIQSLLP
jgi:hypothetical protein